MARLRLAHEDEAVDLVQERWAKAYQAEEWVENGKTYWQMAPGDKPLTEESLRTLLRRRLPLEEMLHAVDITASKKGAAADVGAEKYFFGICWKVLKALEDPQTASTGREVEPPPRESGVFKRTEVEKDWQPCTPSLNDVGLPDNWPEWWGLERDEIPPEVWLETPVRTQEDRARTEAFERKEADLEAGDPPDSYLTTAPGEPLIRNPAWVRYWRKYYLTDDLELIRARWGPDGVGNYSCVYRRRETMSHAEQVRLGSALVSQLEANARPPWSPRRVSAVEYEALLHVLEPEDIFLDEGTGHVGMRVWINDKFCVGIEAVGEDDYLAVACYFKADDWTPPGVMTLADYEESERNAVSEVTSKPERNSPTAEPQ